MKKPPQRERKQSMLSGMSKFFGFGSKPKDLEPKPVKVKKEKKPKQPEDLTVTKHKKLPKNFASKVLDLELKLDSGRVDIASIDLLM